MRYILTFLVLVSLMSNAQDISLLQQLNGRYDYLAIGNTMNQFENGANGVCVINTESSATLTINDSSQIIAAYLYWAGSGSGDFNVMLNDIEITAERTFSDSLDATREFFAAFADVSGQIINTGTGNYTLSQLDLTDAIGPYCSSGTNFAGWAIVVVYENDVLPLNQVNIYDGLQSVPDELTITLNNLNVLEAAILKKLFNEFRVKNNDLAELKKRIDIVPISLAIAQAAIESGWGTSRFAQEGNAYFGQKIIGIKVDGIRPNDSENPLIKVRIFENLNDSVKAYLNNLNTHFAYKNFRKSRNELRSFGKTLEGEVLANELKKYSELGNEYINNVQEIIRKNNLGKFDFIEYRSAQR